MTDEEFATRLEIRLDKFIVMDACQREKLWHAIAEVRSIERDEINREIKLMQRRDIHPVCYT